MRNRRGALAVLAFGAWSVGCADAGGNAGLGARVETANAEARGGGNGLALPVRLDDSTQVDPAIARAVARAWQAAADAPDDGALRFELAQVYDANGLFELARRAYMETQALDPEQPRALYHQGCMELRLGAFEQALGSFQAAREREPDYAPVHWQIAGLLLDADRLDEAQAAYRRAAELAPYDPTGEIGQARVALQRGDAVRAVEILGGVVARWPDDGWAHALLARALTRTGDRAGAESARARASEDTHAWVDSWRVDVRQRAVGYGQAVDTAKEHLQAGRPAEAIAIALQLQSEYPHNVTVQGLLTAAWVATGEYERALTMLERAALDQPNHYRIEMNLGIVHARAGRPEAAAQHVARALELNEQYAQGHAFLGDLLVDAGRWEEAERSLAEALRLGHRSLKALMQLGRARASLGAFDAAIATFQHAIRSYPGTDSAWAYLALACMDGGRFEEAGAALAELAQRAPEHSMLEMARARLAVLEQRATEMGGQR